MFKKMMKEILPGDLSERIRKIETLEELEEEYKNIRAEKVHVRRMLIEAEAEGNVKEADTLRNRLEEIVKITG